MRTKNLVYQKKNGSFFFPANGNYQISPPHFLRFFSPKDPVCPFEGKAINVKILTALSFHAYPHREIFDSSMIPQMSCMGFAL